MRRYVEKRIAGRDTIIANKVTLDLSRRGPRTSPLQFFQCLVAFQYVRRQSFTRLS